jgi:Uncharacterized protein conserved in bacteria (DUF2076)
MSHLLSKACSAPALKEHDDVGTMVAQFGWRHMFAACGIATAVAVVALSVSGLPRAFDFVQAGSTSHRFTNPRHDPAAYHPPSNAVDPLSRQNRDGRTRLGPALTIATLKPRVTRDPATNATVQQTDSPDKDPEAETLIRQTTAEQPDAAYHLVQTVLIQDLSLHVAQNRIAELEKSLAEAKTVSFLPHSFLGGLNEPVPKPVLSPA